MGLSVYGFAHAGTEPLALFACLVGASFFGNGVLSLLTGPIATEAVGGTHVLGDRPVLRSW